MPLLAMNFSGTATQAQLKDGDHLDPAIKFKTKPYTGFLLKNESGNYVIEVDIQIVGAPFYRTVLYIHEEGIGVYKTVESIGNRLYIKSGETDQANAVAFYFKNNTTLTDSAAKFLTFEGNGSNIFGMDMDGTVNYKSETTGANAVALGANSPAVGLTAPYVWLKFRSSDYSVVYVPAWK